MDRIQLLRQTSFFGSMSTRALELIYNETTEQTYEKGEYIFFEGDHSHAVFIILANIQHRQFP